MKEKSLFVGRQPIFDSNHNVYGYELLFRGGLETNFAEFDTDEQATATVVHNAMMGFTLDELVGNTRAFINFPESFFTPDLDPCFSSHRIVCEVLETVPVTEDILTALKQLKEKGFLIALDDFIFKKQFIPFLALADIIKVDIENIPLEKIEPIISKIRNLTSAMMLVERVETKEAYNVCLAAGCDYFQGYYFAKPEVVAAKKMSVAKVHLVELLQRITDDDIGLDDLETIIAKDVGLMHKLIKLAAQHRTARMPEFDTLKQVMFLFGLKRVQSWASMISLNSLDDVVPEVFNIARIRAIFMRNCAEAENLINIDSFYLAGMFSLLDVILEKSMEDALNALPLSPMIERGLLHREGDYGRLLTIVIGFEKAKTEENVPAMYSDIYLNALRENQLYLG